MADLIYPITKAGVLGATANGGPIDWDADPIFIMLVNSTYAALSDATKKTHDFRDDITSYEISGTGYTAGGVQLTSPNVLTSGDSRAIDFADAAWTTSTITASGAVVFKRVGADMTTPENDPLICFLDFGGSKSSSGGTFTVVFNASGLYSLT